MKMKTSISNPSPVQTSKQQGLLYVIVATVFFGCSGVLSRWSAPLNALEISFWRLALATLVVLVFGLISKQPLWLKRHEIPRFVIYGLITALHFAFYIASLTLTTLAHSLSLTYTAPIFVAIFSALFLREHLTLRKYLSIAVAIIGIALIADFGFEPRYASCSLSQSGGCMWLGDIFAIFSAICLSAYSIAGRGERERHPLFRYAFNVYGFAALWLSPILLLFAWQHPYPLSAIASVLALGILPLGLGHTLYNAAVRLMHATYASIISTQEVTIGVLLGILFLQEIPSWTEFLGMGIALLGIIGVIL